MTKPKLPKLNSKINIYEKGRLLPHCPMKVTHVDRSGDNWTKLEAIDTDGNVRTIKREVFTMEIL